MPQRRDFYELRIAHAEGHTIQFRPKRENSKSLELPWVDTIEPRWHTDYEWRIKPEPKPDLVYEIKASLIPAVLNGKDTKPVCSTLEGRDPNFKLTFDGETGKLKSAEVLSEPNAAALAINPSVTEDDREWTDAEKALFILMKRKWDGQVFISDNELDREFDPKEAGMTVERIDDSRGKGIYVYRYG